MEFSIPMKLVRLVKMFYMKPVVTS